MRAWLIQIDAWDGATAYPVRMASHDDERLCHLDDKTWWPVIARLPTLRYDFFDGSFDAGSITSPSGDLEAAIEAIPALPALAIHDARIRIWGGTLGDGFGAFALKFDGRVKEQPTADAGTMSISFGADDGWLDEPLLSTYAGTGGAEGGPDLEGQVKPLALGAPRFAPATLVDAVDNIYQLSGHGPIGGVEVAFERLNRFGPSVGNVANFAALKAAAVPRGEWTTCLAQGFVKFGAPPEGMLCFHLAGDVTGGWSRLPGDLIRRIATIRGHGDRVAAGDVAALNGARPWPLSILVTAQTTARELIQKIAMSVNAVAYVDWLGVLRLAPLAIGAPTTTIAADGSSLPPVSDVRQVAVSAPYWKIAQGAAVTWQVHGLNDIAFSAPLNPRGPYDPEQVYREGDMVTLPDGSQWLFVATVPAAGSMPADGNADWFRLSDAITLTAGNVTYEGGETVEALKPAEPGATHGATPEQVAKIDDLEQLYEEAKQSIDDLIETYGSTAAAAASASAADQHRATAQAAAANALAAKQGAEGAYAETLTRAGEALTYRNQASQYAQDSAGAAATASEQAVLSAQARNASDAAASASVEQAGVATAKAAEAGQYASAASTSQVSASNAAAGADAIFAATFPNFVGPIGKKAYVYAGDNSEGFSWEAGPDQGWPQPYITAQGPGQGGRWNRITFKESVDKVVGRRYRVTGWFFNHGGNCLRTKIWLLLTNNNVWDANAIGNGGDIVAPDCVNDIALNQGGFWKVGIEFTVLSNWPAKWKPVFEFETTGAAPNGLWHMTGMTITDITSEKAAADSASAASASYSAAEYQAGQAGQSAQAASGYANTAIVKAGESAASAAASAGSAATANEKAAAASASANLSATFSVGGGNRTDNSDLATGEQGWDAYTPWPASYQFGRDLPDDNWRPTNEHALVIHQLNGEAGQFAQRHNARRFSVTANKWYEWSVLAAAHRANVGLKIEWYRADGSFIRDAYRGLSNGDGNGAPVASGGRDINNWTPRWVIDQAPGDAAQAHVVMFKDPTYAGEGDSWAWFTRMQFREVPANFIGPSVYAPSNGKAALEDITSAYLQTVTVVAGLEGAAGSFDQRLQVAEATVGQAMGAIQDINGKTTTYWQVYATGPNGETYIRLVNADGRSAFIVGTDLRVMGDAVIDGTINASALALDRFVKRVGGGGAGSPSAGQMLLLYAGDIGVTRPNGSYALELDGVMTTNVGRSQTTLNGRPYFVNTLPDGGLLVRIMKGATVLAEHYMSASDYATTPTATRTLSLGFTKIYDAPANDTVESMATLLVYGIRGNSDTGVVDEGDYYNRDLSALYSNFSISAKVKWTFI